MVSLIDTGVGKRPEPGSGFISVGERSIDERTAEIVVAGELDLATAPRLKWSLMDSLKAGHKLLLVNLGEVTFIDSTALSVLVGVHRKLDDGAHMAVVCTNPNVLRIFEVAGLKVAFEIFPTPEQGLSYLREGTPATPPGA
jgi:anti-sigma B factor antagonist